MINEFFLNIPNKISINKLKLITKLKKKKYLSGVNFDLNTIEEINIQSRKNG